MNSKESQLGAKLPKWTERSGGRCPQCQLGYHNKWKPKNCSGCGFSLGGHYVPNPNKRVKLHNPECVELMEGLFSIKTGNSGKRCFALINSSTKMCYYEKCLNSRNVTVGSIDSSVNDFNCEHMLKVKVNSRPEMEWELTEELIENYPCDATTKICLQQIAKSNLGKPVIFKVASKAFVVLGFADTTAKVGFVHVYGNSDKNDFRCSLKNCNSLFGSGKQVRSRKICIHQHAILCALYLETGQTNSSKLSELPSEPSTSTSSLTPLETTYTYIRRASTVSANLSRTLPYTIPIYVLNKAQNLDAATLLDLDSDKCPTVFIPEEKTCRLCRSPLGNAVRHPGSRGKSYLLTEMNPFRPVEVLIKECRNKECKAMHQVWPFDIGLFNICDKVLVTFKVLLEWREQFKRGVPISLAIASKVDAWCKIKVKNELPSLSEQEYLCQLLYNGFYAFEIITERSLDSTICGICGVIGEFYLGDGNEKNCCSKRGIKYEQSESGAPIPLEGFLQQEKKKWLERILFSSDGVSAHEEINVGSVPPIIAPSMRAEVALNSEMEKKSLFIKSKENPDAPEVKGDPALLHNLVLNRGLDMTSLQDQDVSNLKSICKACDIPLQSGASKSFIISAIHALYASLLVGNSPCHGFNKVDGHTGGFYHIVCRHGTTVASKFLFLQESVRDAADLYLSLRYKPPVFICDTPCGVARHMDLRVPDVAQSLWGDKSGCFEKPLLGRKPSLVSVPHVVPLEYRSSDIILPDPDTLSTNEHPISRNCARYIMGDRFHTSTEPHKSPLCSYHDIRLCEQALTLKTSFQESENHRKNFLRLRSSTMQSIRVHFLYNYLMDFYHNEQIIERQMRELLSATKEGHEVKRDKYMRFTIVRTL